MTGPGSPAGRGEWAEWEGLAPWWQATFTAGADPEYEEQILPLAAELLGRCRVVVDVGAGEGQVARAVRAAQLAAGGADGSRVVAVEPSPTQAAVAVGRGGGVQVVRGTAGAVPVADGAADGVLSCLVLEHLPDLDGALAEVARILRPGGRLVAFLNHPILQSPGSTWVDDHVVDPPEHYYVVGPYLRAGSSTEPAEDDLDVTFHHRPLGAYVNGLVAAGVAVERLLEPEPPPGYLAQLPGVPDAAAIPRLLVLIGRRGAGGTLAA